MYYTEWERAMEDIASYSFPNWKNTFRGKKEQEIWISDCYIGNLKEGVSMGTCTPRLIKQLKVRKVLSSRKESKKVLLSEGVIVETRVKHE